jgi:hypothetical protein
MDLLKEAFENTDQEEETLNDDITTVKFIMKKMNKIEFDNDVYEAVSKVLGMEYLEDRLDAILEKLGLVSKVIK